MVAHIECPKHNFKLAETIDVGLEVDCSFLLVGLVTVVDIVGEIVGAVVLVDWRSPCERRFASSSRY